MKRPDFLGILCDNECESDELWELVFLLECLVPYASPHEEAFAKGWVS